jgi:hypothetical protein
VANGQVVSVKHTSLHPESYSDAKDGENDGQWDGAGMKPNVAPIRDGKHDNKEDEGTNNLVLIGKGIVQR